MLSRYEQLEQEAMKLAIHCTTPYFFAFTRTAPCGKFSTIRDTERKHFLSVPCYFPSAVGRMVACVLVDSDIVEHHVEGECPYRIYYSQ